MVHGYTKPLAASGRCSYLEHIYSTMTTPASRSDDGNNAGDFADDTAERDRHLGEATAMISYTWDDLYITVVRALEAWCAGHGTDPESARIWMCSLRINQYSIPENLEATFGLRVEAIGLLLPLLLPWEKPNYICRLWCLYEFFTTSGRPACLIEMIFSPEHLVEIETEGAANMVRLEGMLASIDCASADASFASDRDQIRRRIMHSCGFQLLDTAVRELLRKLFMKVMMSRMDNLAMQLKARHNRDEISSGQPCVQRSTGSLRSAAAMEVPASGSATIAHRRGDAATTASSGVYEDNFLQGDRSGQCITVDV